MREKELSEPGESSRPPGEPHGSMTRLFPHADDKAIDSVVKDLGLGGEEGKQVKEAVTTLIESGYSVSFNFSTPGIRSQPALDVPDTLSRHAQTLQRLLVKVELSLGEHAVGAKPAPASQWTEKLEKKAADDKGVPPSSKR